MSNITNENQNKKKALGRGLGSLLGAQAETSSARSVVMEKPAAAAPSVIAAPAGLQTEGKVWQVSIDKIAPGEYQPRQNFKKEAIDELAQSIRNHGIIQPIMVRKRVGREHFEIVAGERRWRAAQMAGLHEVPVIIKNFSDKETLELGIIENIQREDLNPIEEAEAYQRLIEEFEFSQQMVADRVGKERATVANALRLLTLPAELRAMIQEGAISSGHGKALLSIEDITERIQIGKRVATEKWSVRKLEGFLKSRSKNKATMQPLESSVSERLITGLAEELQKTLGTKVQIDYAQSKGKISIHFYSDDELTRIIDKLKER